MTRTELIHSLISPEKEKGKFISKSIRGNTLWTLWKSDDFYIVCYCLIREESGWGYKRETEDTPFSSLTCPNKYLTETAVICENWRSDVEKYVAKKTSIKSRIRSLYNQKEEGQKVQVTITAKDGHVIRLHDYALKEATLDIVSVRPSIEGRFNPNGLRYKIPLRLVSEVILLE